MTNNKYKILLVEDDGSIRSIMTTMLESAGYQVIPADTCGLAKTLFASHLPDVTILAEIYAAREKNDIGISSQDLAAKIPGAVYCSTLDQVADQLAELARPGDLILTVGAGDIFRAGEKLLERN